jgi:methenyltetrahydrofolate cyclohydrolase
MDHAFSSSPGSDFRTGGAAGFFRRGCVAGFIAGVSDLLDLPIREYMRRLCVSEGAPGAGCTAAMVGATAAALVEMAARASQDDWQEAGGTAAQAAALRARLDLLCQADAEALEEALTRLEEKSSGDQVLGEALGRAAEVPLRIAEAATDVAELAAHAAREVRAEVRADAGAAAVLAEAAARTGAKLVEVNLATLEGDERLERARKLAEASSRAAARALRAGRED